MVRHLNTWLHRRSKEVKDLDESTVGKFQRTRYQCCVPHLGDCTTFALLLQWLRNRTLAPWPIPEKDLRPHRRILDEFSHYLRQERGLAPATVKNYVPVITRFLGRRFGKRLPRLNTLCSKNVIAFIFDQANIYSRRRIQSIGTALRIFLRFLRLRGDIKTDLAASVPMVANHQWVQQPRSLPPEQVERLLKHCARDRAVGQRDYAMLLLMARLGLRAGELLLMSLDDVDWEAGAITVNGKGNHREQLPLPQDVGEALVTYLKEGRPCCSTRRLFIRTRAPFTALARSSCISSVVRYACKRAGLSPPHQGAHLLRHTLATQMLRDGASLAEIAEILRHRLINTTEIYAQVDLRSLRKVVTPWPGG